MSDVATSQAAFRRLPVTWYGYLAIAFFTFVLNIQGNVLPFLKTELDLSYRVLGLHSSALAVGMILAGLVGDTVIRLLGRSRTLLLGMAGAALGAGLLCVASSPWITVASCALIGSLGGLIPGTVLAVLSDAHGARKDVAYTEAMATCYAFGILAPLASSLCIWLALGWRAAILGGIAAGAIIAIWFRGTPFPQPARRQAGGGGVLPLAFWVYWVALGMGVAIEFCVLLWSPEYLERVVGLSRPAAAGWAATFFLAMLIGRLAGSALVRFMGRRALYLLTVGITLGGFALYWIAPSPATAIAGLFGLGLGISMLYPLSVGSAIGAAGPMGEKAGTRLTVAVGIAILTMPALLGLLADMVGLHGAHAIMPALALAGAAAFVAAGAIETRNAVRRPT